MSTDFPQRLLQESRPKGLSRLAQVDWAGGPFPLPTQSEFDQEQRILQALGVQDAVIPRVDEATLFIYYRYLLANLSLPLTAYVPKPGSPGEEAESRCIVVKLIDPRMHDGSATDGIFSRIRHGDAETALAVIDLCLPEESPSFQLIEDYWYWFWNWQ